ncbi:hypothetical protein KY330_05150 [Candidatus Woesearchaeota archaeon]|nr:hypothetical protein [Candidatus Woesearchaeota archaeon]
MVKIVGNRKDDLLEDALNDSFFQKLCQEKTVEAKVQEPEHNAEKKNDPWGLLGLEVSSKCCKGKKAKIIGYEHTGELFAECECGETYWHDKGAYG